MLGIVTNMRIFSSWASVGLAVVSLAGCQRLDGGDEPNTPPDTDGMSAGNLDDVSGGSLLESGGEDTGSDEDPQEECNPVTGAPCTEGEKCTVIRSGGSFDYVCVGESGTTPLGNACTVSLQDGLDGCTAGSVCLGADAGTCRPLCKSNADCEGATCVADPFDGVPHCADDCSPFEPACAGMLQCRRQGDRFSCLDALPGDVGGGGDACQLQGDAGCGEGFVCLSGALVPGCGTAGCCVSVCDLDAADTCSAPSTCTSVLEGPAPGFEAIGACFVPA